jgi:hypothetical protein
MWWSSPPARTTRGYFAYIPTCGTFPSALGDFVASALNIESSAHVSWDGTSQTMSRFVDAGQYLYHRFSNPIPVDAIPWRGDGDQQHGR